MGEQDWQDLKVYIGEQLIPRVEHDVGTRYLGVRIDAVGDWGYQLEVQEDVLKQALATMGPARIRQVLPGTFGVVCGLRKRYFLSWLQAHHGMN